MYPSQRSATCSTTWPNATVLSSRRGAGGRGPRDDHGRTLSQLQALGSELERSHPSAAASLRGGMAETLRATRLRVKGRLKRTPHSTNRCESMIETVSRSARNVQRWPSRQTWR